MVTPAARLFAPIVVCAGLAACAVQSAGTGTELAPAPPRAEATGNAELDSYVAGLRYNPRLLLAEQSEDLLPAKPLPDEVTEDDKAFVICHKAEHRLSGNIDDIVILDPLHGVVWPGALVKVDEDLVRGTPTPIRCRRGPA